MDQPLNDNDLFLLGIGISIVYQSLGLVFLHVPGDVGQFSGELYGEQYH